MSDFELSLEGYRIGGIENRFRLQPLDGKIRAGGYRVFEFPYRSLRERAFEGSTEPADDAGAIERRELEARERSRRHFPGFSPDGGTLGLFVANSERRPSDDDDRPGHRLIDWYFYGPHRQGYSYGRNGEAFGFQKPSPGKGKP